MKLRRLLPLFIISIIFNILVALWAGYFGMHSYVWENSKTTFESLINMTFVSGVLFIALGILILASTEGIFDIAIYGTRKFIYHIFNRKHKLQEMPDSFFDYYQEKRALDRPPLLPFFIIGLVQFALMGIFYIFYYQA